MTATARERNWAGNVEYGSEPVRYPRDLDELAATLRSARSVRVLGTRHSFSDIACSVGALVSLERLPWRLEVDTRAGTATVAGNPRYGELATALHRAGVALANLGSLPHISVAGACATGTHGSGTTQRCLAAAVRSVDLVTGTGDLRTLRRGERQFPGAVVNLGALGAVVGLTLDVEPTYEVRQDVYDDVAVPPDELTAALADASSVSLFSDLRSERFGTAWLKHRLDGAPPARPSTWRGGVLAASARHPVPGQPVEGTTVQGEPGPWHERLPHFRLDRPPSSRGDELQSEFLVAREDGAAAWQAVLGLRSVLAPLVQVAEVRAVAADDLWLSMAEGRDSVALHLTWVPDEPAVREALRPLERALDPFAARPHWGKVFVDAGRVPALYPHLGDFAELAAECDPAGRLRNGFVERFVPR